MYFALVELPRVARILDELDRIDHAVLSGELFASSMIAPFESAVTDILMYHRFSFLSYGCRAGLLYLAQFVVLCSVVVEFYYIYITFFENAVFKIIQIE